MLPTSSSLSPVLSCSSLLQIIQLCAAAPLALALSLCSEFCPSYCSLNLLFSPVLITFDQPLWFHDRALFSSLIAPPVAPALRSRLLALALDSCSDYCSSSFIQTVPFFDSAGSLALWWRIPFAAHPHHRSSSFAAALLLLPSFTTAFFAAALFVIVPFPCCSCSLAAAPPGCCTRCCRSLRWFCGLSLRLFFFAAAPFR